jgi:hypothetical protein
MRVERLEPVRARGRRSKYKETTRGGLAVNIIERGTALA